MTTPTALVQKLWNYCGILRDDGLSYGDYVERLTFLLFLKMADLQVRSPFASAEKRRDAAATFNQLALLSHAGKYEISRKPVAIFLNSSIFPLRK